MGSTSAVWFGWIDGLKKRMDEVNHMHRFSSRKPRSNRSLINILHVEGLKKAGRMTPAGLKAYEARALERSGVCSFEDALQRLAAADEKQFRANPSGWEFFQRQPPGYWRIAIWWVV